jgi:hypothetical protein
MLLDLQDLCGEHKEQDEQLVLPTILGRHAGLLEQRGTITVRDLLVQRYVARAD